MASDLKVQVRELVLAAQSAGWRVKLLGCNHYRFYPRDRRQPVIHTGSTPQDYRGVRNLRSALRRAGLEV